MTNARCYDGVNKSELSTYHRYVDRVKRNAANPADVIRLLKQPAGQTRNAVRAADYMEHAVKLIKKNLEERHKRSINDTGMWLLQITQIIHKDTRQ